MGEMGAEWLRCSRTWVGMGIGAPAPGEAPPLAFALVTVMDCKNRVELGQLARTFCAYCKGRIQNIAETPGEGAQRFKENKIYESVTGKLSKPLVYLHRLRHRLFIRMRWRQVSVCRDHIRGRNLVGMGCHEMHLLACGGYPRVMHMTPWRKVIGTYTQSEPHTIWNRLMLLNIVRSRTIGCKGHVASLWHWLMLCIDTRHCPRLLCAIIRPCLLVLCVSPLRAQRLCIGDRCPHGLLCVIVGPGRLVCCVRLPSHSHCRDCATV